MKVLLLFLALFLVSCSNDEKQPISIDINQTTPPPDVPIAKSDANIAIDKDFPPSPVAE
ncbi:hypothetical protein [Campylobacter hyointestinalis]|uniref:hypothetical protein n=1 Tax=Campylobacter hyointestinalis TaxID=198 RepID=UPI00072911FF|nr:hypothetical protein [Campylobacter hyointestinalis]ANE33698.1 hypothetical protein CHL_0320 [Campylobacter hyointestinalis subsp. lawsonii CCUG 27631]CUU83538.1 Uncharacterised protein [Campylobacter hyointestinalis]